MNKYIFLMFLLACDTTKPQVIEGEENPVEEIPADECPQGVLRYDVTGTVTWITIKNSDFPVIGTQGVTGTLQAPKDALITEANTKVNLVFNHTPSSGVDTRDVRIANYIFGRDKGEALTFKSLTVAEVEGTPGGKMPAPGETVELTFNGDFSIAGRNVSLGVPVYISNTGVGLVATNEGKGLTFDLRTGLKLGARLDEMLALVNARLDDLATVRFNLNLQSLCE